MLLYDEMDVLDEAQHDVERAAETSRFETDVDRRKFVFLSLATAAATTFGFGARSLAQGRAGNGVRGDQPAVSPVPLDNMEGIAWTFQPYPGGTGALLEKTYEQKGISAFKRQQFAWGSGTAGSFALTPWGAATLPATDEEIAFLPVHRLAAAIKAGRLTSTRLTTIYLDRLKKFNPTLFFAVTIMEQQGLAYAAQMDAELKAGKYRGPLHGIPWGVKDLFAVKGTPTTWGAADFETRVIDEDSEVVTRLRDAGAVLIAKLSTGQFASGGNWFRGGTRNPWNTSQTSSGSSAGPGSATAAGCVAFGIGTETSGSIVSPASTCGLSALRPTFGRVSRYGGMVLSWSQDRVGPLTRTAEDAAIVFNVIHGSDPKDSGTITMPFHFNSDINLSGLRIGLRKQNESNPDPVFAAFVDNLRNLGAKPTDIGDPPTIAGATGGMGVESAAAFDSYVQMKAKELNMDMATVLTTYGRATNGAAGGGGRGGTTPPVAGAPAAGGGVASTGSGPTSGQLNRWVSGRTPTAMDFVQSQRRRQMLISAWQEYLKDIDLYIGAADTGVHAQTGHPVAVVQMGFGVRAQGGAGRGALPVGRDSSSVTAPVGPAPNPQPICTQIAGNLYNDDVILSVAHKYQSATDWHNRHPKLTAV